MLLLLFVLQDLVNELRVLEPSYTRVKSLADKLVSSRHPAVSTIQVCMRSLIFDVMTSVTCKSRTDYC